MKFWIILPLLLLPLSEVGAQVQTGPRFVVSTLTDRNNAVAMTGDCTLREAIRAATATGQPAIIVFAKNLTGTLTLSASLGQLSLTTPVTLLGPGARKLTVTGGGNSRIFGASGGPHLIADLSISGGKVTVANEGGGGISNSGNLIVQNCSIVNNQAISPYRYVAKGGGILSSGTLTMTGCTISGNTAKATDQTGELYGDNAMGGGVHISGGAFTAQSCTFYNNTATGGAGSTRNGWACGAIYNKGATVLRNCTVSGNEAKATDLPGIGGVFSDGGSCTVFSTIIAINKASGFPQYRDVRGGFISEGFNLIGAVTGSVSGEYPVNAFNQATDQRGTHNSPKDPGLGSFLNNGGPTDTLLPVAAGSVVDKGKGFTAIAEDQRGGDRVVDDLAVSNATGGDGSDIGATELGADLSVATVMFSNGQAKIRIIGEPGVRYTFEYSDNLEQPWTPFDGTVLSDGSGAMIVIDPFIPGPQPPRRFYRGVPVP